MSKEVSLQSLRREWAERYKTLSAAEKPHVTPCPDCGEPPYVKPVCPETGVFHERERHTIVGGEMVRSNVVESSALMAAIDRSRVRWVASRTQLVRADAVALNLFQSFVRQLDWTLQRYGILYGTYDAALATVEVHAIYEPEQHGDSRAFHFLDDPRIRRVDRLAELLGLRRVGAVCTHPARNVEDMVLSAREMLLCAREQSRFGDECVLLTMSPNVDTGRIECQAWQTSPQAVHFYRLGVLSEKNNINKNNHHTNNNHNNNAGSGDDDPADGKYVYSSIPLEVAQQETDEKGHMRVVTRAPSQEIDTRWFTSYVAVQQFESSVVRNLFMRISRPGMEPPTLANLRNYMEDPKRRNATLLEKLADFHVLLFLADGVFSLEDDMPVIIGAMRKERPAEDAEPYEMLLRGYLEA
ncbi:Nuclear pore localization protein NPL4 [Trypanosoma melophagium]|uniref:Nuclear pore localization protein NPL4 n=1 Tax=Trypanosoma melophagium TaxID=715481 RepID=UPI00351A28D9|nr:Nuclear pore localization protein NPL4 [Trypanosoma melophagium]